MKKNKLADWNKKITRFRVNVFTLIFFLCILTTLPLLIANIQNTQIIRQQASSVSYGGCTGPGPAFVQGQCLLSCGNVLYTSNAGNSGNACGRATTSLPSSTTVYCCNPNASLPKEGTVACGHGPGSGDTCYTSSSHCPSTTSASSLGGGVCALTYPAPNNGWCCLVKTIPTSTPTPPQTTVLYSGCAGYSYGQSYCAYNPSGVTDCSVLTNGKITNKTPVYFAKAHVDNNACGNSAPGNIPSGSTVVCCAPPVPPVSTSPVQTSVSPPAMSPVPGAKCGGTGGGRCIAAGQSCPAGNPVVVYTNDHTHTCNLQGYPGGTCCSPNVFQCGANGSGRCMNDSTVCPANTTSIYKDTAACFSQLGTGFQCCYPGTPHYTCSGSACVPSTKTTDPTSCPTACTGGTGGNQCGNCSAGSSCTLPNQFCETKISCNGTTQVNDILKCINTKWVKQNTQNGGACGNSCLGGVPCASAGGACQSSCAAGNSLNGTGCSGSTPVCCKGSFFCTNPATHTCSLQPGTGGYQSQSACQQNCNPSPQSRCTASACGGNGVCCSNGQCSGNCLDCAGNNICVSGNQTTCTGAVTGVTGACVASGGCFGPGIQKDGSCMNNNLPDCCVVTNSSGPIACKGLLTGQNGTCTATNQCSGNPDGDTTKCIGATPVCCVPKPPANSCSGSINTNAGICGGACSNSVDWNGTCTGGTCCSKTNAGSGCLGVVLRGVGYCTSSCPGSTALAKDGGCDDGTICCVGSNTTGGSCYGAVIHSLGYCEPDCTHIGGSSPDGVCNNGNVCCTGGSASHATPSPSPTSSGLALTVGVVVLGAIFGIFSLF